MSRSVLLCLLLATMAVVALASPQVLNPSTGHSGASKAAKGVKGLSDASRFLIKDLLAKHKNTFTVDKDFKLEAEHPIPTYKKGSKLLTRDELHAIASKLSPLLPKSYGVAVAPTSKAVKNELLVTIPSKESKGAATHLKNPKIVELMKDFPLYQIEILYVLPEYELVSSTAEISSVEAVGGHVHVKADGQIGTIGAVIVHNDIKYLLSNKHVFHGAVDDEICLGRGDDNCVAKITYKSAAHDFALAKLNDDKQNFHCAQHHPGGARQFTGVAAYARIVPDVEKYGARTHHTTGDFAEVSGHYVVMPHAMPAFADDTPAVKMYGDINSGCTHPASEANFCDHVLFDRNPHLLKPKTATDSLLSHYRNREGKDLELIDARQAVLELSQKGLLKQFSAGGDSGSAVVDDHMAAVALLYSGAWSVIECKFGFWGSLTTDIPHITVGSFGSQLYICGMRDLTHTIRFDHIIQDINDNANLGEGDADICKTA